MKQLLSYLEKNGIQAQPETFGTDYFYNSKVIYNGLFVTMDYRNGNARRKFENYCKRYGYEIFYTSRIRPDYTIVYSVARTEDRNADREYNLFAEPARREWEEMQHSEYSRGNYDIEQKTREIMTDYENRYLQFIKTKGAKTA